MADFAAICGLVDHRRPAAGLELAGHGLGMSVVDHFLHRLEGGDGALVERAEAVEVRRCPVEHALAAALRQADEIGDDRHRQVLAELGGGVERFLRDQTFHQPLGFRVDFLAEGADGDWRQRLGDDAAQDVVLRRVTAQRIARERVVHRLVHGDAGGRGEDFPVAQRVADVVVARQDEHVVAAEPDGAAGVAETLVVGIGIEQGLVGIEIDVGFRTRCRHALSLPLHFSRRRLRTNPCTDRA